MIICNYSDSTAYNQLEIIGEGTWGKVWKALDCLTGRFVAIKRNHSGELQANFAQIESFILAELTRHSVPHIPRLMQAVNESSLVHQITMEYIPEKNVRELYCRHECLPLTLGQISLIAQQSLELLSSLCNLGIVHGDLTLNNMLYQTFQNNLTVIDFGTAFKLNRGRHIEQVLRYRSPEQVLHAPYRDLEDVWSLGCLLFEMCTQRSFLPFKADEENDEKRSLYLIAKRLGALPSKAFLSQCNKGSEYYEIEPEVRIETAPDTETYLRFDEEMRAAANWELHPTRLEKRNPAKLEQLIALIGQMLRYQNRAKPQDLLQSTFFADNLRFHLTTPPFEGRIQIFRMCDVFLNAHNPEKSWLFPAIQIDPITAQTRHCHHLEKDPRNLYFIRVHAVGYGTIREFHAYLENGATVTI